MTRNVTLVAVLAMSLIAFAGCYYKQEHDENPTGPNGTGVQGYYLNVHCVPATVPANGNSAFTISVWLRDLSNGQPIPGQNVYLSLWNSDVNGMTTGPFDVEDAHFDNSSTRILVTTGTDGTATAVVRVGSAYFWGGVSDKRGAVLAEITLEGYTRDPVFISEYGYFLIYNPFI